MAAIAYLNLCIKLGSDEGIKPKQEKTSLPGWELRKTTLEFRDNFIVPVWHSGLVAWLRWRRTEFDSQVDNLQLGSTLWLV